MEKFKVEYDSLHKFRVSLGLLIWALPWIVRGLLVTMVSDNISQKDFDELSDFSKDNLMSIWNMRKVYEEYFLLIVAVAFLFGLVLQIIGMYKWRKVQMSFEENQRKNNEKLGLEIDELADRVESVKRKILEDENYNNMQTEGNCSQNEINEGETVVSQSKTEAQISKLRRSITVDQVMDYLAIEDKVYKQLRYESRHRYDFIQNVTLNRTYEIDIVAQSRNGGKDIVYEVKKFTKRYEDLNQIDYMVKKLDNLRMIYEAERGRKAVSVFVLVANPKDDIHKVENLLRENSFNSKVRIMSIGE